MHIWYWKIIYTHWFEVYIISKIEHIKICSVCEFDYRFLVIWIYLYEISTGFIWTFLGPVIYPQFSIYIGLYLQRSKFLCLIHRFSIWPQNRFFVPYYHMLLSAVWLIHIYNFSVLWRSIAQSRRFLLYSQLNKAFLSHSWKKLV